MEVRRTESRCQKSTGGKREKTTREHLGTEKVIGGERVVVSRRREVGRRKRNVGNVRGEKRKEIGGSREG